MTLTNPPLPLAVRPREAARVLGVSVRTLRNWTRDGRLQCVRVGGGRRPVVLYSMAQLQEWLAKNLK
jgi:excisionase family DNA binding protein